MVKNQFKTTIFSACKDQPECSAKFKTSTLRNGDKFNLKIGLFELDGKTEIASSKLIFWFKFLCKFINF